MSKLLPAAKFTLATVVCLIVIDQIDRAHGAWKASR